ncbi:MAG: class II fructose-bisphosphatase [Deltaproteobacteria bacterium]|nr:class II fructose-bisphosphatase [Deltaproteobacteria bacterium]
MHEFPIAQFRGVVEKAAIASAQWRGKGNERAADQAAVDAMRSALGALPIDGIVAIGEGERDEAPMLYIGEKVGISDARLKVDFALDPLEGTTICAKYFRGALSLLAVSERGGFLHAPDTYMQKIAVGPRAKDAISIERTPAENLIAVAEMLGKPISDLTVAVLDRNRHEDLICDLRQAGARIKLFTDGDVSVAIETCLPGSGVDLMMGVGGSTEGVLAAAALKCLGGNIQGKMVYRHEGERERGAAMGINPPDRILSLEEMARKDVFFFAAGVTDGELLKGVRFGNERVETQTLILSTHNQLFQYVTTLHPKNKF